VPERLQQIDELTRKDHPFLSKDDVCIYWGEYTARKGYAYSEANTLILNFKKSSDRKGRPEWHYKLQAIDRVATIFRNTIKSTFLAESTIVPIPPSKAKSDPLYDDRMTQAVTKIAPELDIRELVSMKETVDASHASDNRPTPARLTDWMEINRNCLAPIPKRILLFDDVITTGAHFVAVKTLLREVLPSVEVFGFFIARRVPESSD
jgi:hypothetical protein